MTSETTPPTTDEAYSTAARAALVRLYEWFTSPGQLLSADQQERFISTAIYLITLIVESEPHLRGAVINAADKLVSLDKDHEIERAKSLASTLMLDAVALGGFTARASALDKSDLKGMRSLVRDLKQHDTGLPLPSNS